MHRHAAAMRMCAVLPKINSLPGSECEFPICDWNRNVHCGERRADVRRHVVLSFRRMFENCVAVRHEARKEFLEVAAHFGIGIFLDDERSGSVLNVESDLAGLKFCAAQERADVISELIEAASSRGDLDFVLRLA